jgi:general secretion pathway protein L
MNWLRAIGAIIGAWTDSVATMIVEGLDRIVSPRLVRLTEQADGGFALHAEGDDGGKDVAVAFKDGELAGDRVASLLKGSRLEIALIPRHFLFRTLELPAQAADFLEGIVRAQIDRLTPWSAHAAVFGCSAPQRLDADRIATTVAVAPRPFAMAYVSAALAFQPASVSLSTQPEEAGAGRVRVFEQKARGFLNVPQLSGLLKLVLAVCAGLAVAVWLASLYIDSRLEEQKVETARQIAQAQAQLRAGGATRDQVAVEALERRKHELPPATLVLDALSQVLPDHTYVTEMHITGPKAQVIGITRDAPSLIRLIEQSPLFSRATFFAPTTRTASDPGERFHIEVRLEPIAEATR